MSAETIKSHRFFADDLGAPSVPPSFDIPEVFCVLEVGPPPLMLAVCRVPAVYLRLALWAFLAYWEQRKMSKLRGFSGLL